MTDDEAQRKALRSRTWIPVAIGCVAGLTMLALDDGHHYFPLAKWASVFEIGIGAFVCMNALMGIKRRKVGDTLSYLGIGSGLLAIPAMGAMLVVVY